MSACAIERVDSLHIPLVLRIACKGHQSRRATNQGNLSYQVAAVRLIDSRVGRLREEVEGGVAVLIEAV